MNHTFVFVMSVKYLYFCKVLLRILSSFSYRPFLSLVYLQIVDILIYSMIRTIGLLLIGFVAHAIAIIKTGTGFDNPQLLERDVIVYYLDSVFDVTGAVGNVTFTTNGMGTIRDYKTPIAVEPVEHGEHAMVQAVEFIDNQTFAAVLDSSHIYIQSVHLEGTGFSSQFYYPYIKFGADLRCDDIEIYRPTKKAYVACWSVRPPTQEPGKIYLLEIDMTQPKNETSYRIIQVDQSDDWKIQFRIRIILTDLTQGTVTQPYIILYDQATSGTHQWFNKWFRVFDNLHTGTVSYRGIVNVTAGYMTARTLYDIFSFNNQLLLTTMNFNDTTISMASCTFNEGLMAINCSEATRKRSGIIMGYIGMTVNNHYVAYDYNTETMKTCAVGTNFYDPAWITTECEIHQLPRFPDTFVQLVEDNWHGKMATFVYPNGEYAGVSLWSRELNKSWSEVNTTGVLINRHFYEVQPSQFIIRDLDFASLLVKGENLIDYGNNVIQVTATDSQSTLTLDLVAFKMKDASDDVTFDENHHLPEINAYENSRVVIPMYESDFYGNNLNFIAKFEGDVAGHVDARQYSTYAANVLYNFQSTGTSDFTEISFTANFAIASDRNNRSIYVFSCGFAELADIRCDELYSSNTFTTIHLKRYSIEVFGHVFAWATDSNGTFVYIFGRAQNDVYMFHVNEIADDAHAVEVGGRLYIFVSYQGKNIVYVKSWSPENPSNFVNEAPITAGRSDYPQFCPNDIFDTYKHGKGYLEIMSSCYNSDLPDQRIFRYTLPDMRMAGSHPINTNILHPEVCAIGDSYIVSSRQNNMVEGRSQYSDETRFYFNLHEFKMFSRLIGVHCIAESDMVVAFVEDSNHRLAFYNLWGDSQRQANKRVHSVLSDFPAGTIRIESFTMGDKVIHTLYSSNNDITYYVTLAKQPVILLDIHGLGSSQITGEFSIIMNNTDGAGAKVFNKMTLRKMDSSIQSSTTDKEHPSSTNFSLEDYVHLKGHVFNASIRDSRSDRTNKVHLLQRTQQYAHFHPSEIDQTLYQHVEAHGDYTIALHKDTSQAGFFTIFRNSTERVGSLQPRVGIQAFDFGIISDGRAVIAYTSSASSGARLYLTLVRGADKIYETSITGNFTKIRFGQIDKNNNLLLFGVNQATRRMEVIIVSVTASIFTTKHFTYVHDVVDFDVTDPGNKINLYYIGDESIKIQYLAWNKNSIQSNPTPAINDTINIQGDHQYWLESVSCMNEDEDSSSCVVNTVSSIIFEFVVANGQNTGRITQLDKFGNYDGKYLYIDEDYIAMRAVTTLLPRQYAFLIWKRPSKGGDGKLYAGIPISGSARPGIDINSGFTPYTLIKAANGKSMLFAGTHNPFEPLQFHEIQTFRIVTDKSDIDLSNVHFDVYGFHNQDTYIGNLGTITHQKTGGMAWWWIVLLVLGVLIIASGIYYFVTRKTTDPVYEKSEVEGYKSVGDRDVGAGQQVVAVNHGRVSDDGIQA